MEMVEKSLTVGGAFLGSNLEFIEGPLTFYLDPLGKTIESIEKGSYGRLDFIGYLAIPAASNMHVHGLDYSVVEEGYDLDIDSLVGEPYGLKYTLLKKLSNETLCSSLKSFIMKIRSYGVGFVAEFRELGIRGLNVCDKTKLDTGHFVLAMPEKQAQLGKEYIDKILKPSDGIGISSPLYFSPDDLSVLYHRSRKAGKLFFSHVSEVRETYESGDLRLLLSVGVPDAVVHGTWLTPDDLLILKELGINLIICLRSNLWFLSGFPRLKEIYNAGISVSLGTDNGGWVKPDIWRDAELLYLLLRKEGIDDPLWVLKALINASPVRVKNFLAEGKPLNMTLIKYAGTPLEIARNKAVALIKRGGDELVRCVLVNGSPVYEQAKDEKALCHSLRNDVS